MSKYSLATSPLRQVVSRPGWTVSVRAVPVLDVMVRLCHARAGHAGC